MAGNLISDGAWIPNGNPFQVSEAAPGFVPGQLGKVATFANAASENGIATGAPIKIQAVSRYATDTVAVVQGDLAFWQDMDNFVVTSQPANAIGGTTAPVPAGVFGSSNLTFGSIGYIQVGGVGPCRVADSTSAGTVGHLLVWSTDREVRHLTAGTQVNQNFLPAVGVLKTLNTATTTHLSVEVLLTVPRHSW